MMDEEFEFRANVWLWDGPSPWYFVTVPVKISSYLRKEFRDKHGGWGSLKVEVIIGSSIWKTSIFWEKKGTYILPIKRSVRSKENIINGSKVNIKIKTLIYGR